MEIYKNLSIESLPNEEWRDIVGYEGLYQVSNLGRVKVLPRIKRTPSTTFLSEEKIVVPKIDKGGYLRVALCRDKGMRRFLVHRLVATSFFGDNPHMTVNHKDENKTNNSVENLEYLTRAENVKYGTGIKRSAMARVDNPNVRKTPVKQYTLDGVFIKRYISINQAKRENNFKKENISLCCLHRRKTSNGFIWRYDGDTNI